MLCTNLTEAGHNDSTEVLKATHSLNVFTTLYEFAPSFTHALGFLSNQSRDSGLPSLHHSFNSVKPCSVLDTILTELKQRNETTTTTTTGNCDADE